MGSSGEEHVKTLEENLWDVMIFTVGGTPGAIVSQKWDPLPFSLNSWNEFVSAGCMARRNITRPTLVIGLEYIYNGSILSCICHRGKDVGGENDDCGDLFERDCEGV